ncbi:tetratricopeptide repeat protein [Candidatus Eisenbacteria bacterium]|uniref:Tetratricopeptide repeat protein n=1 Tax=Eiseniibacteriota bacterium TaxID=2212470 RepID=A0ABV6YKH2_UNCEI
MDTTAFTVYADRQCWSHMIMIVPNQNQKPFTNRATLIGILVLPALLAVLTFINTLWNGFVYDDQWTLSILEGHAGAPPMPTLTDGRGLTYLVHDMDRRLWSGWPAGFHLTNVLLHAIASALAAVAAFRITRSQRVGLITGLAFAVHPVHSEVVACFAYRKDALAMIFILLAFNLWITRTWRVLSYPLALCCFGLALLSKEVAAIGLPMMFLLTDLLAFPGSGPTWKNPWRSAVIRILPILVLGVIAISAFAGKVWRNFSPEHIQQVTEGQLHMYGEVLAAAAAAIPCMARLLCFPIKLCADYGVPKITGAETTGVMLGIFLIIAWCLVTVWLRRRAPAASFAAAWVLVMLLPCSNIVPLTHFFVAERYLYVPSFGICLLAAIGFDYCLTLTARRRLVWLRTGTMCILILVLALGAVRSATRNKDWRDGYTLWSSTVEAGCITPRALCNLGIELRRQGRVDEAVANLHQALLLDPQCHAARQNLAKALHDRGDHAQAIHQYRVILQTTPDALIAKGRLAWALATCPDEKLRDSAEAVRLAHGVCEATNFREPRQLIILAVAHAGTGNLDEAYRVARKASDLATSLGQPDMVRRCRDLHEYLAARETGRGDR